MSAVEFAELALVLFAGLALGAPLALALLAFGVGAPARRRR